MSPEPTVIIGGGVIGLSIAYELSSIENRERKRNADAQGNFEHAIQCFSKKLWLGTGGLGSEGVFEELLHKN